jgi:hypothetical protein
MPATDTERRRIEDAVVTLASYSFEPMVDYVRNRSKPQIPISRFNKNQLRDAIRNVLMGELVRDQRYELNFDALIDYLDALQETGRQHLYLFRLPEAQRDALLAQLRDRTQLKALLKCDEEICNGGRRIYETAKGPELALVKYELAATTQYLLLKWIETRKKPADAGDEGETEEEAEEKQESAPVAAGQRAATFFVINLENGECDLRIQDLETRALKTRTAEMARFRTIIEQRLGFALVGPLGLGPAIRSVLLTGEVDVLHLTADLYTGGRFVGGRKQFPPVDLRRLETGLKARFAWKQTQPDGTIGSVVLDARINEVLILKPLLPDHHRRLIETVRQWWNEGMVIAKLPDEQTAVKAAVPIAPPPPPEAPRPEPPPPATRRPWREIVKPAIVRTNPEPPSDESPLEDTLLDFDRSHESAKPNVRALWELLAHIRDVAAKERVIYERELDRVRIDELWNFRVELAAAVLGLIVFAAGAYLVLFDSMKAGGLSMLLGLLGGRGTILTRQYAKSLKEKREYLQHNQRAVDETVTAIHATLSNPDRRSRTRGMIQLTEMLLNRVRMPARAMRNARAA